MQFRPPLPALKPDYSHITVVANPEKDNRAEGALKEATFIRKSPLPEDYEESLPDTDTEDWETCLKPPTSSSSSEPRNYAQVASFMGRQKRAHASHPNASEGRSMSPSNTASSSGILKIANPSKSRQRKWEPLILATEEESAFETAESETGGAWLSQPTSKYNSPARSLRERFLDDEACNPKDLLPPAQYLPSPVRSDCASHSIQSTTNPAIFDTPNQCVYRTFDLSQRSPVHTDQDTPEQALKINDIMARIDDAFDVEEWDPDLPSMDNSLEHLDLEPKPAMAYTTVGSLIRSNSPQQFNAPIRIQREGVGRRFPPSGVAGRSVELYSNNMQRGLTPGQQQANIQRQLAAPYSNIHHVYPQPRAGPSTGYTLDDSNEDRLQRLGVSPLREDNTETAVEDISPTHRELTREQDRLHSTRTLLEQQIAQVTQQIQEFNRGRQQFLGSSDSRTLYDEPQEALHHPTKQEVAICPRIPDRMQSLQNLSKIPNPVLQQQIRDRLSGAHANVQASVQTGSPTRGSSGKQMIMQQDLDDAHGDHGFLDIAFQFPAKSTKFSQQVYEPSRNTPSGYYNRVAGRPEPLSAGPPGRRNDTTTYHDRAILTSPVNLLDDGSTDSWDIRLHGDLPAAPSINAPKDGKTEDTNARIVNTLGTDDMLKYYPQGFPPGAYAPPGSFKPLSETEKAKMGMSLYSLHDAEMEDLKKKWRNGNAFLDHNVNDYADKLKDDEYTLINGQNPPNPRLHAIGSGRRTKTNSEIMAMSEAECAAPLLNNLYGTLQGYAEHMSAANQKNLVSRWEKCHPSKIDSSVKGNKSFFGEDYGVPVAKATKYVPGSCKRKNRWAHADHLFKGPAQWR